MMDGKQSPMWWMENSVTYKVPKKALLFLYILPIDFWVADVV